MSRRRSIALGLALLLLPVEAFAEVADKMPSPPWILGQGLILSALVLVLSRWHRWLAVLPTAAGAAIFIAAWNDAHDSATAAAMERELGHGYITMTYVAAAIPIAVAALVLVVKWRSRK